MNISSLSTTHASGSSSTTSVQTSSESNTLGKDAFLTLLVTQLQNQDPLNPADSTEFTAQLAQFSSLEKLTNINGNLEALNLYQASINNVQAVSLIGKEILASGDGIEKTSDEPVNCEFELGAAAKNVVLSIYDSNGEFVTEVVQTSLAEGRQSIAWDGCDGKGNKVANGTYTFKIQAEDTNGNPVAASTLTRGRVSGVTFDGFTPVLMVGERRVAFGNVLQIIEPKT